MKRRMLIATSSVFTLIVLYLGASLYIANLALVAEATPIDERPEDLELPYEEVAFAPRDWPGIVLRGWWIPATNTKGTVIRVHGIDSNRGARLGLVHAMVEDGYSVLTFDLRGHGESDKAQMGAGLHERDDVRGAIDYVLKERGAEAGSIMLHGLSYGAAIALMAAPEESAVVGVFADSAFSVLGDLIVQEVADRTPLPTWTAALFRPGAILMGRLFKGVDIGDVRPVDVVAQYSYPLAFVHCRNDERIPIKHLAALRNATEYAPRLTAYEQCDHADAWDDYPEHYELIMLDYFDERLGLFD